MPQFPPALLALADGTVFRGKGIGATGRSVGEVVFNTSMTGYQEILSDPSYCRQIVTLTYPHIGNTGVNREDEESARVFAAGLVIRDLPLLASNYRSQQTLDAFLRERQVVAIADIDTRKLTRILREKGAQAGCLVAGEGADDEAAVAQARSFPDCPVWIWPRRSAPIGPIPGRRASGGWATAMLRRRRAAFTWSRTTSGSSAISFACWPAAVGG